MKTPDKIYLIDMGDEVTWCDCPDPSGYVDERDVVSYTKTANLSESHLMQLLGSDPTPEQIFNACLNFRHDYGLLNDADAGVVKWNALEWLKAWKKALGAT